MTSILKKFPKIRMSLVTMGLTSIGGILGWLGTTTLKNIEEIERVTLTSQARIERLENDDAKWGTLAEQQKQIITLTIEIEVLKRLYGHPSVRPPTTIQEPEEETEGEGEPEASKGVNDIELNKFKAIQEGRYKK